MAGLGEDGRSREALLAELERRSRDLELAQSIAKIGSWDYTASDGVLRWSDELFRVLGYEPQSFEPTSTTLFEKLHPEDLPTVEAAYATMTDAGTSMAFDARILGEPREPTGGCGCAGWLSATRTGRWCTRRGRSRT